MRFLCAAKDTDEEHNRILDNAYSKLNPDIAGERESIADIVPHIATSYNAGRVHLKPMDMLKMQFLKGEISEKD